MNSLYTHKKSWRALEQRVRIFRGLRDQGPTAGPRVRLFSTFNLCGPWQFCFAHRTMKECIEPSRRTTSPQTKHPFLAGLFVVCLSFYFVLFCFLHTRPAGDLYRVWEPYRKPYPGKQVRKPRQSAKLSDVVGGWQNWATHSTRQFGNLPRDVKFCTCLDLAIPILEI